MGPPGFRAAGCGRGAACRPCGPARCVGEQAAFADDAPCRMPAAVARCMPPGACARCLPLRQVHRLRGGSRRRQAARARSPRLLVRWALKADTGAMVRLWPASSPRLPLRPARAAGPPATACALREAATIAIVT